MAVGQQVGASEPCVVVAYAPDFGACRRQDFPSFRQALDWAESLFEADPRYPCNRVGVEYASARIWMDGTRLVWCSEAASWAADLQPHIPPEAGVFELEGVAGSELERFVPVAWRP